MEFTLKQLRLINSRLDNLSCAPSKKSNVPFPRLKNVWVKTCDLVSFVVHTSLKVLDSCHWYLDSAFSKHISGDKYAFKHFDEYKGGSVNFKDENQAKIKGNWSIEIKGLPKLREVLCVKDLKENLLIISQICDED